MSKVRLTWDELETWHQEMIGCLLVADFPGKSVLAQQMATAEFAVVDDNRSLAIFPAISTPAPVEKTVPVEANTADKDGVMIQVLLFVRAGTARLMEVLREDGEPVISLPRAVTFKVVVLAP